MDRHITLQNGVTGARHEGCECPDNSWMREYPQTCGEFRWDGDQKTQTVCANCEHEEACHAK